MSDLPNEVKMLALCGNGDTRQAAIASVRALFEETSKSLLEGT